MSACAVAALALIAASSAKADVPGTETFTVSGDLGGAPYGPSVSFNGTFEVDFGDNFVDLADPSPKFVDIMVNGRSVFNQGLSVSDGIIGASNSSGDTLTLLFSSTSTSTPDTWVGFETGDIFFGYLVFGPLTGSVLYAEGVITRTSGAPITDPPVIEPPDPPSATVPEPSTWTMMLVGLAGLGLAAKGRRALAFLGGRG